MKVILIENNAEIGRARVGELAALGFTVEWFRAWEEASACLPQMVGYEAIVLAFDDSRQEEQWQALEWLVERARAPVLITGTRAALPLIEQALDAGAEDFLLEPVDPRDLAVRIRASARRGNPVQGSDGGGRLHLNPVQRTAIRDGESVALTSREYIMLAILMAEPGRIVSRIQLQEQLRAGADGEIGSNTVEVHIHNLRRKLGERLIRTARGRGYWVDLSAGQE